MNNTVSYDTSEFNRALKLYLFYNNRDNAELINKTAKDYALLAAKYTPRADGGQITQQSYLFWWPKYIAKRMFKPYKMHQAKSFSRTEIAMRRKACGYLKSGWFQVASTFSSVMTKGKHFKGSTGTGTKATPKQLMAYKYEGDARGAERILNRASRLAFEQKTRDLMIYVNRKMDERAKEISAKR